MRRGSPVVSVDDNYGRLGYPPDAAARDARYTRYVTATSVLRTHTSAMIPGLLSMIASAGYTDLLLACPGLVYRRDRIERLSVGEPHQLDLWRISNASLDEGYLGAMIAVVLAAALPAHDYRSRPTSHPYTGRGSRSRSTMVVVGSRSPNAALRPRLCSVALGWPRSTADSRWASDSIVC